MMKLDHIAKVVLITGCQGTGKTTLAEELMRADLARRKFIYDPEEEFAARLDVDAVHTEEELELKTAQGGWICYAPEDFEEFGYGIPELPGGLACFSEYVLVQAKTLNGRKLFFCDELDVLTGTANYPRFVVALLQLGRRRECDCYLISGQPNRLHNSIRAKITEVYTFVHVDGSAIEWLVKNGIPEETIRGLGKHGWFHRNLRTGETDTNVKTKSAPAPEPAPASPDPGPAEKGGKKVQVDKP